MSWSFHDPDEQALSRRFLAAGYVVLPVEDLGALERIRALLVERTCAWLDCAPPAEPQGFLDHIHQRVEPADLNALRVALIGALNAASWARPAYYALARRALTVLVGNELAMQRRLNLSIQLPGDAGSLLPLHADVWAGDSPFELVLWVPLVDCRATKSMFLLPPAANARLGAALHSFAGRTVEDVYRSVEPDLEWLEVRYGQVLVFNQTLAHGNRVNQEPETRWSLNARFKGVFTPYADKKLGEFFEPITLRAASRIGLDYRLPGGFDE